MKKRYSLLLFFVIFILLAYVLKDINFKEVYQLFKGVEPHYIYLSFLACLFSFLFWNLRFQYSMKGLIIGSYWFLLKVLMAGVFVNTITPGSNVGGEPVRAYFLKEKYKKPKSKFLGCIFADKAFNLIVFFSFLVFSILFVLFYVQVSDAIKFTLEFVLLIVLLVFVVFSVVLRRRIKINGGYLENFLRKFFKFRFFKKKFKSFKKFRKYLQSRANNFSSIFDKVLSNRRRLFFGILLSLGMWISNFLLSYFLFLAFDSSISFLSVIIVVSLSYAIGDISPVPGGVGIMESAMFLLYSSMGVSPALAAIVALLSRVIYYVFALGFGSLSLLSLRYKLG